MWKMKKMCEKKPKKSVFLRASSLSHSYEYTHTWCKRIRLCYINCVQWSRRLINSNGHWTPLYSVSRDLHLFFTTISINNFMESNRAFSFIYKEGSLALNQRFSLLSSQFQHVLRSQCVLWSLKDVQSCFY